jgi:hypothetical protein
MSAALTSFRVVHEVRQGACVACGKPLADLQRAGELVVFDYDVRRRRVIADSDMCGGSK